ncbi:MAG TPA: DUF1254 domain-containing protein [Candidatus Babeliaceae bacterium]|nr:DUF1254 domain-containing protein [Candidatus Babeliaceae bacterium]
MGSIKEALILYCLLLCFGFDAAQCKQSIAVQAYIYGYPLVLMEVTRRMGLRQLAKINGVDPINRFAHTRDFLTPAFTTVVSPNVDTLYSIAWIDLSHGPLILQVPDTKGHYYVMQFLDAWTNTFANPGTRTTGSQAQQFILIGPDYKGVIPEGYTEIRAPTPLVWIIGRTQCDGLQDFKAVHQIQQGYRLMPFNNTLKNNILGNNVMKVPLLLILDDAKSISPNEIVDGMDAYTFFTLMMRLMKINKPADKDIVLLKKIALLGLDSERDFSFYALKPEIIKELESAVKVAQQEIKNKLSNMQCNQTGWVMSNLHRLGSYGANYMLRAITARFVLGANLPEDAVYAYTEHDACGHMLDGRYRYKIHFSAERLPPVNAFWSLTLYNKEHFLAENSLNRYAIHYYDALEYNPDGSFDIYIQYKKPRKLLNNWLPTPQGIFNLILRLYWPKQAVLQGQWLPPLIEKC